MIKRGIVLVEGISDGFVEEEEEEEECKRRVWRVYASVRNRSSSWRKSRIAGLEGRHFRM